MPSDATAYRIAVNGRQATVRPAHQAIICAAPAEAVAAILDGDAVTVAGVDMGELRQALQARGYEVRQ
jgi:hypothetical protein